MEPLQFAYWLQGFSELNEGAPTPEQWQSIKEHLATVFKKVTPPVLDPRTQPYRPGQIGIPATQRPWVSVDEPQCRPLRAECVTGAKGMAAEAIC